MIYPILHWTEKDVWHFLKDNHMPINPCYEQTGRVGCMFCPFSSKKQIDQYEKTYPKFKEHLLQSLNIFWQRHQIHELESPEQYYEWWKSKKNLKAYRAEKAQLSINL